MNYKFSSLPGGNRHNSQPCVSARYCSLSSFQVVPSQVAVVTSYVCAEPYSADPLRGVFKSLDLFLVLSSSIWWSVLRFLPALTSPVFQLDLRSAGMELGSALVFFPGAMLWELGQS